MDKQKSGAPGDISEDEAFATFSRSSVAMVLTNPSLPDNPIVYVNDAFERVTGYSRESAIGRNCRFLQGEKTDREAVAALRRGIEEEHDVAVDLVNYRADGKAFVNRLLVAPVRDETGELRYFLGIQKGLSDDEARRNASMASSALHEIQHRVKNHLAMIVGLIRMQARKASAQGEFSTLSRRVESLQLLYEELTHPSDGSGSEDVDLGAYLSRVATAISHLDGRSGIRVGIEVDPMMVPVDAATRIGLALSEILTNAMQHAFEDQAKGVVSVKVSHNADGGLRAVIADDGCGIPEDVTWPNPGSLGGRIVIGLLDGLDAAPKVERLEKGTRVTIDIGPDAIDRSRDKTPGAAAQEAARTGAETTDTHTEAGGTDTAADD